MSEVAKNTGNTRNTWQKTTKKTNMTNTNKQGNNAKGINTKKMNVQRRGVDEKEYNELKLSHANSLDTSSSSIVKNLENLTGGDIEEKKIGSNTNNTVAFNSSPEKKLKFKNELVKSLYKKFQRRCSIDEALKFFKSNKVLASYFDDNFWDEILYVINLNNCTIKQLVEFKQNVVILANKKVSWLANWLGPKMAPEKIKFAVSPDMFQKLVYNDRQVKGFLGDLDGGERQKYLDSFRIVLDGSNDDMGRESCGKLLNFILEGLEDNRQPVKDMIVLLQICRVLLGIDIIPVNVDGWKKIFTKIKSLSIKDFLKIRLLVDNPEVKLGDLEKFLFSKLHSKGDTQDEVQQFIDVFFPNDKIKSDDPDNCLYVFNLFIGSFPSQELDFSFVTNFAQQRLGLKLSDLSIEGLTKLLSKVKPSSINSNTFKALVELVKGKNIVLGTRNGVDELRQLLCDVLRISEPELDLSDVMDLFLLYPKMPKFCTKSTLTNKSLKLALEEIKKISAVDSKNEKLGGNKDEFRIKLKEFIDLFEDVSNKITFDNFKNLILVVPNDYLDFEYLDYVLQKTDIENHEMELCEFFETDVLKKISKYKFDLKHVRGFFDKYLPGKSVKNYKFKAETFRFIVDMIIQSNKDCSCNNEDIKWLLQKCCDAGTKLENGEFVSLIKKGNVNKKGVKVEKIKWSDMYDFINKIVSPKSGLLDSGKIELNGDEIYEIHRRSSFNFDSDNLSVFTKNTLALKKFVTGDQLFEITLNHIPYGGLKSLGVFKKVVYYCFEDVENYNSDIQIPIDYCHKIDSKLYSELLKTFEDGSLSYDDFKTLNSEFFSGQQSGNLVDFLFGLLSKNESNIKIDHKILRKKLKGDLFSRDLDYMFSKFGDEKLPKNDFVEILMLAEDNGLTKDDFINLFNNHCNDRIETESNDDMLSQIAGKISDAGKEDLRNCLIKLNVEKGINQLLNDIKKDFSVLFKLTDQKLKEYGLGTLLNQSIKQPLLNQDNGEANLNSAVQGVQNVAVEVLENLDEGKYGTRMSVVDFKTKYPDIWGRLDKEQRVYLQMILGYKQSLLPTIFCLFFGCVIFVPATTFTYCLGLFWIIYFLLKLIGERTRNRLTEMVQGKRREPSFWDRFFVWNKSVLEDAMVLCGSEKKSNDNNNDYYREAKGSILSVMLPEHVSFFDTASSARNTALRMVNRVSSLLDKNVL